MQQHPSLSYRMLAHIEQLQKVLEIPLYHPERWDGSSYPQKLRGNQIPLSARIFANVDVWDALLSDRPFHKAWSKEEFYRFIEEQSAKLLVPNLVSLFLKLDPEYITIPD
jgi:response regulator RpfG family c-di-GMP phosphodiesterase